MKYSQLDRITYLQPGKRIVAERTLGAEEDFLLDHFPNFPVMPGVMMLEALVQASTWMIRTGEDFQSPLVMLREVRSVKFGDFLGPGETLQITAELLKEDGPMTIVKAIAQKEGRTTVSARLIFERRGSGDPERLGTDEDVSRRARKQFGELFGEIALSSQAL